MAAVLVLSGCGGSSSSSSSSQSATSQTATSPTATFKGDFKPAVDQLRGSAIAIGTAIQQAPGKTDAQNLPVFRQLATRWQSQLSKLQTLTPPASLAAPFNTLTGAASRVETDLNGIVSAGVTHSKSAASQAFVSLLNDILAAKSASATITKQLGIQ